MKLESFVAGHLERSIGYRYFLPEPINQEWTWQTASLNVLLERAGVKLGELNSFARLVPNIDLFIQLHVTKEAVVSSRIEGTQTNMEEAVLPKAEIRPERRDDWQEVNNYIRAMNEAIAELKTLPLSSRLLRNAHKMLLSNGAANTNSPASFGAARTGLAATAWPTQPLFRRTTTTCSS